MTGRMASLETYLKNIPATLPERPKALLVVSAHWEERVPTVQTSPQPGMLYDYHGFPEESYSITWPAPGSPKLAKRIEDLFDQAGIESGTDAKRGFDHGTFVVTKLMIPKADIPTIQLSLTRDLDPRRLFEIGIALAPLRDEGVLILGSGYSYHNMRGFFAAMANQPGPAEDARAFDGWLAEALLLPPSKRAARILQWEKAPAARACHPREEHLLPLFVCAGAGEQDAVTLPYHEELLGLMTLAARFG
jgi:aromatic ring-opening dioxygenase catalytic subunit (LigB family)